MGKQKIRPIAICVMRQGTSPKGLRLCDTACNRILVYKGFETVSQETFYRPVGGGIDFGESSHDAVIREVWEELETQIEAPILLGVLENIFAYEGELSHEIVFVYDAMFCDRSLYNQTVLNGLEGETPFEAVWLSKEQIQSGAKLYPSGLQALLGW